MANLTKENISVTPGNFELSGGVITAISGYPVGGTGSIIESPYHGDTETINVDQNTKIISISNKYKSKIDNIPTKVTDLTDSANYATNTELQKVSAGVDYVSAHAITAHQSLTNYYNKEDVNLILQDYYNKAYIDENFATTHTLDSYVTQSELANKGYIDQQYYATYIYPNIEAKQDKLTFGYDSNDKISAINGSALAGTGGLTGDYYSASNPSGFVNATQVNEQIVAKQYLTEASGNARYIPIPDGLSDNQYYAYTTSSWKVIQGAGDVSGISTVAHDDTLTGNGNQEALGVALSAIQSKLTDAQIQNISDVTVLKTASSTWDNVSAKLNTSDFNTYTATTAPNTYQAKGDYLSSNALNGYATEQWVGQQGYITQETDWTNTIQEASAKAYNDATANANSLYQTKGDYVKNTDIGLDANSKVTAISGKELIITAHQSLENYYTKSETSGATELSTEFAKYLTKTIADGYYYPLSTNPSNYATSAGLTQNKQYAMTTTGWAEVQAGTSFTGVTTASPITGDGLNNSLGLDSNYKTAIEQVSGKVDKPSSLIDKYLVLRTDSNGAVSGWCDFQDQSYSKTEALGTFVATANIDSTTLSGDGKSVSTKLGVKTDVIATIDYVNISFLPTSGGTVSGQLVVSGDGNFDQENLKFIRSGLNGYGRIGLASNGALAVKVDDSNSNTTQINVAANASYNELIQVQHGGTTAYLIPAVTANTTAGLTNDGILHIIVES